MTIIVGLDTETTDLKVEKGARVIEIALIGYELETEQEKFRYVRRLNPGALIAPKAALVHGIRQADLIGQPTFDVIEPVVSKILSKADIVVAHNLDFDITFLVNEYQLIGRNMPSDAKGFDTVSEGRWATSFGKNPTLGELCYALGVDYDLSKAHGATYDVEVMMQCLFRGMKLGGFNIKGLLES